MTSPLSTEKIDEPARCPLCNGEPVGYEIAAHSHAFATFMPGHPGSYVIECPACDFYLTRPTQADAIAAWNRRSPPVVHAAEPVAWRDETDSEHIARDMAEGRFPKRSERQKRPAIDDVWDRIRDDDELASVRSKCSMHELRRIINHAVNAHAERLSAIAAASPQGDGHSVGVKGLEWALITNEPSYTAYEALTALGRYEVWQVKTATGWTKPRAKFPLNGGDDLPFEHVESAKAAAQADFDARIRSALVNAGGADER